LFNTRLNLTGPAPKVVPAPSTLAMNTVECTKLKTVFKVNLFGPSGSGKTALLNSLDGRAFDPVGWETTGPYFTTCAYKEMPNSTSTQLDPAEEARYSFALQLWDCSGKDLKDDSSFSYLEGTKAIVLCYAVNDPNGLNSLKPFVDMAKKFTSQQKKTSPRLFLLGCKVDCTQQISSATAQAFAQSNDLLYMGECSARTNTRVDAAFSSISHWTLNIL